MTHLLGGAARMATDLKQQQQQGNTYFKPKIGAKWFTQIDRLYAARMQQAACLQSTLLPKLTPTGVVLAVFLSAGSNPAA